MSHLNSPAHLLLLRVHYITFIDAFSHYAWIYLLKLKSEALNVFKQFKAFAELQSNTQFKSFQTDWWGEHRPTTQYLNEFGHISSHLSSHSPSKWYGRMQTYGGIGSILCSRKGSQQMSWSVLILKFGFLIWDYLLLGILLYCRLSYSR